MSRPLRDYPILDKDLGRISNAEHASVQSLRPVIRFGIALILVALVALAAIGGLGHHPSVGLIVAGLAVGTYLALSIGGNDVANSLGPAVGAGAIGLTTGLLLVGMMQVAGAVLAGGGVTGRLADGIVMPGAGGPGPDGARIMVAALFAAATWISLATWAEAPVSTTHSIVGAILGAGVVTLGWQAVNWHSLAAITAGWVISPLVSGMLAAGLMALLHVLIRDRDDPLLAARRWLPWMIALTVGLFVGNILNAALAQPPAVAATAGLTAAAAAWVQARIAVTRQIRRKSRPRAAMKAVFRLPLVGAALLMGFAHGANDAANVIAPLSTIFAGAQTGALRIEGWMPLLAGLGIAAGAILFGRRLVHMVGSKITRLNSARAFCVLMATALTVIGASVAALPVSTTHVAVGGVFGVGFYREWRDRRRAKSAAALPVEEKARRQLVRRSHVRTIFGAWLITVPAAALLSAALTALIF